MEFDHTANQHHQAFECPKNPSDAWKASFPRNSPDCNDVPTVYYTMAAINILTDLFVLVLPIAPALNLKINRRKKGSTATEH
jgi:hypothetical protein